MVDCLAGDLDLRLGLPIGALSILLLTRGEGEGERGGRLLPRPAEGDMDSLLTGDLDLDLRLREGGGVARLSRLLREEDEEGGGTGEASRLSFGLRGDFPLCGDFDDGLLLERCGDADFDLDRRRFLSLST